MKNLNPVWNPPFTFKYPIYTTLETLQAKVWDWDLIGK